MDITHVFFDIGGVLGTNGWDREQRSHAIEHFGLDEEFEQRHHELAGDWEIGCITLAEYLESAVFYEPRSFSRQELEAFMLAQSERKPSRAMFERGLGVAQAEARRVVLIDDREQNLAPARSMGFQTIHFTTASALENALVDLHLL
jgi:putative hydrolase of the HAD superfamily